MYQFFVEPSQIQDKKVIITGGDVNHIKNVLRLKPGEEIAVKNGVDGKEYRCGIEEFTQEQVICSLRFVREEGVELPSKIYLFQGIPKADKMELIVQKAVELGVSEIIPVAMKNCVVKLDQKRAQAKQARWQAIAESAAKQSKRSLIPTVGSLMQFQDAAAYAKKLDVRLLPYENQRGMAHTREVLQKIKKGSTVGIFIGPEGGYASVEIEQVQEEMELISLGNRVLRTETAGLCALSMLIYALED